MGSFNAPLGGALFGLEILFQGVTLIESIPVFFAAAIGALIANIYFGANNRINFTLDSVNPQEFGIIFIVGMIFALIAFVWIKFYHGTLLSFKSLKIPEWLKPAIGALCTGIIIVLTPMDMGLYGTGINGIEHILENPIVPLLILLFGVLKMISTSATIGSGGSGGIFGPSYILGLCLVVFLGIRLNIFFQILFQILNCIVLLVWRPSFLR